MERVELARGCGRFCSARFFPTGEVDYTEQQGVVGKGRSSDRKPSENVIFNLSTLLAVLEKKHERRKSIAPLP